jgi:hypothetical protein
LADNTTINAGTGGDVIATDDLTTLNGGAVSGVKVQRVKLGFGSDATLRDVDASNPLPIVDADAVASGTITATDAVVAAPAGAGALVTGTSTANSYVGVQCPGSDSAWIVEITGLTSGTLYFEESVTATGAGAGSWINVNGRQTGIVNTVLTGSATTNGVWRGNTSGAAWFRIRSVGTLTGTPAITIRISGGTGAIFLNASIPPGTNTIGATPLVPQTTGGLSIYRLLSAATTNAQSVKGSAGQLYGWYVSNVNAAARFLKIYNTASAPTAGSGTPVMTIAIPGGSTAGAGANVEFANGIAFGTGIGITITGAVADNDTTAIAANEVILNLLYK